MTNNFSIQATAKAVPHTEIYNQDLASLMATSDEWIQQRTGIKARHVAATETTTSLAVDVAQQLLQQSQLAETRIDLIIVATMSPDFLTPATAPQVQAAIGAANAIAFDINVACAGFVYGMQLVHQYLQPGQHALLIGSETLSHLVDWHDRRTAVLFGDGAGGMLIAADSDVPTGRWLGSHYATFGADGHYLTAGQQPRLNPWSTDTAVKPTNQWAFQMNGRRVYDFATKQVPRSIEQALTATKLQANEVQSFILHQANARIVASVGKTLHLNTEQLPVNIAQYGNTAAASEPILFAELVAQHQIQRGDKLVFTGFGGGLSVGSAVIEY